MPAKQNEIAVKLIEALEPTGWLTDDYKSIAMELNCTEDDVSVVLDKMQEIEPAGLFAATCVNVLHCKPKTKITVAG